MKDSVDTGITHVGGIASSGFRGTVVEIDDTSASEPVIYPSKDKQLLVVSSQRMCVLTAYDLLHGTSVRINKVLMSNGFPTTGTVGCCSSLTVVNSVKIRSVYTGWKLTEDKPIFIIDIPGTYDIDINIGPTGYAHDALDILVTAVSLPLQRVTVV